MAATASTAALLLAAATPAAAAPNARACANGMHGTTSAHMTVPHVTKAREAAHAKMPHHCAEHWERLARGPGTVGDTPAVPAAPPLFAFESVSVGPPAARRLHALDAQLPARGLTVVAGPSGSGKSTLLRLCNRLEVPSEGVVRHRGEDIARRDPLKLRREVAMVFQRPVTFAGTVLDNLREADRGCDETRGAELLERAGLAATFLARDAGELSGGEAQRACLARALATDPHMMLMDEPTSSLDAKATAVLEGLAKQLVAAGTPVIWVTHSEAQMRRLADFVLLIAEGRVDREGSADEVLGDG